MVGDPGAQASRPQRAPEINVVHGLKLHLPEAPDLSASLARTRQGLRVSFRPRRNDHSDQSSVLSRGISFLTLMKYTERNIDNHMANWKVIATVSGNIEAVSGPATLRYSSWRPRWMAASCGVTACAVILKRGSLASNRIILPDGFAAMYS